MSNEQNDTIRETAYEAGREYEAQCEDMRIYAVEQQLQELRLELTAQKIANKALLQAHKILSGRLDRIVGAFGGTAVAVKEGEEMTLEQCDKLIGWGLTDIIGPLGPYQPTLEQLLEFVNQEIIKRGFRIDIGHAGPNGWVFSAKEGVVYHGQAWNVDPKEAIYKLLGQLMSSPKAPKRKQHNANN